MGQGPHFKIPVGLATCVNILEHFRGHRGFDPPQDFPEWEICQLIPGTVDGFPEEGYSNPPHWEGHRDPPHWESCSDPPHWEGCSDPPHWEGCSHPPHWDNYSDPPQRM